MQGMSHREQLMQVAPIFGCIRGNQMLMLALEMSEPLFVSSSILTSSVIWTLTSSACSWLMMKIVLNTCKKRRPLNSAERQAGRRQNSVFVGPVRGVAGQHQRVCQFTLNITLFFEWTGLGDSTKLLQSSECLKC